MVIELKSQFDKHKCYIENIIKLVINNHQI